MKLYSLSKNLFIVVVILISVIFVIVFISPSKNKENIKNMNFEEKIELPSSESAGNALGEVIKERRSRRSFSDEKVKLKELSEILFSAQGITGNGKRATPSAGATYPFEVYVSAVEVEGLESGIYRYLPEDHSLEKIKEKPKNKKLAEAALGQSFVADGAANILLVADYRRTTGRYDKRGERYVHMEAGHISQNIYLQVEKLGLGTVAVGAFNEKEVGEILGTEKDPLYIMPVGKVN